MSQPSIAPPPSQEPPPATTGGTVVREVAATFKRLDPNMLAVLLLCVLLNGLFFYTYLNISTARHIEFMAALNSCPSLTTTRGS